jgi:hypothetical protein
LQSPLDPTGEYQVQINVTRFASSANPAGGPLVIGLPSLRSQFLIVLDQPIPGKGYASYVALEGYKRMEDNPTFTLTNDMTPRLAPNQTRFLGCVVKSHQIAVSINGDMLLDYRGDMTRLTMPSEWAFGGPRSMFVGAHLGEFTIMGWSVAPTRTDAGQELPLETRAFRTFPGSAP